MDSPFMEHFAVGLADCGIGVVRFEFPYMHQSRLSGSKRPPDRPSVLLETWQVVLKKFQDARVLVIGGKSMGGRIASLLVDESPAQGLICLGYPFHPLGKPEKTRIDHLQTLKTPALVVQGTRDALGKQEEVARYDLSPTILLHWLEDGDHSFKPRKMSGRTEMQNWQEGIDAVAQFILSLKQ